MEVSIKRSNNKRAITGKGLKVGNSSFTGMMWIVLVGVIGLSGHFTVSFDKSRTLPTDYELQDGLIQEKQSHIDELNAVTPLPLLTVSWQKVYASATLSGIEMVAIDETGAEVINTYSGPLKGWTGQFIGSVKSVLSLVSVLQKDVPMYLYDYTVLDGEMKLNFVVVGT